MSILGNGKKYSIPSLCIRKVETTQSENFLKNIIQLVVNNSSIYIVYQLFTLLAF